MLRKLFWNFANMYSLFGILSLMKFYEEQLQISISRTFQLLTVEAALINELLKLPVTKRTY